MSSPAVGTGRRYRILGVLGQGGFGTVYRAELLGEGGFLRPVALKVLNPDVEGIVDVANRLRDEARLLGLIRHRAILQVDGLIRLDDRWSIVMEYIDGVDLQRLIEGSSFPPGVALEIATEVAAALNIAYSWPNAEKEPIRLVHRDIKPSNIMLTAAGEVKVLDFGIARAEFTAREAKTKSVLFGSPGYMAPERLDFEEGPAGDIYSLGSILFEMLTGRPFGRATARRERHQAMQQNAAIALAQVGVTNELSALIHAMTAFDAEGRPSAREVETRTRSLRAGLPIPWLRDWAEISVTPLLSNRGLDGKHDFSASILVERSGGFEADGLRSARTFDEEPQRIRKPELGTKEGPSVPKDKNPPMEVHPTVPGRVPRRNLPRSPSKVSVHVPKATRSSTITWLVLLGALIIAGILLFLLIVVGFWLGL